MQINKPYTATGTLNYYHKQNKELAEILREYRQAVLQKIKTSLGISYYDLAHDIGISESTLINYLKGGRLFKSSLEKIINYLGKV